MKIIGKAKPDKSGRITVANVGLEDFTEGFRLYVDPEKEMICIKNAKEFKHGPVQRIDQNNRITIPKWMMEEIGERAVLILVEDDDSIWLSAQTGSIL